MDATLTTFQKMKKRFSRLLETFIAKKYVAWLVSVWLLWNDKITGTDWAMLTAGIFTIDAWSKRELLRGDSEINRFDNQ